MLAATVLVVATLTATLHPTSLEPPAVPDDREALERLARRYARAFYVSDPDMLLSTVHVELSKKGPGGSFWGRPVEYLEWLEGERLQYAGLYYDAQDQFDETTPARVVVHAIVGDVAALELIAANWYDAFTAVRIDGDWLILDCVWGQVPEYEEPEVDAGESAAVDAVTRTFLRGMAEADRDLLDPVTHPNVRIRTVSPETGMIDPVTRERLYDGRHAARPEAGSPTVIVHNATRRTGLVGARVGGRSYVLQLVRLNGEWKVVNVHWRFA